MQGEGFVLVPEAPLVAGEQYTLEDPRLCAGTTTRSTFTVGPAVPLPTTFGTVNPIGFIERDRLWVETNQIGNCTTQIDAAFTTVSLTPSEEAMPWNALLLRETFVDDRLWNHGPFGATNVVWTLCKLGDASPTSAGLSQGKHDVRFVGLLPGGPALTTPPLRFELFCDKPDEDAGGCSTSHPAALAFVLLALLGLVYRNRR